jgi:hypothetical protein
MTWETSGIRFRSRKQLNQALQVFGLWGLIILRKTAPVVPGTVTKV